MDWRLALAIALIATIAFVFTILAVSRARASRDEGQIGKPVGSAYPGQRKKRK